MNKFWIYYSSTLLAIILSAIVLYFARPVFMSYKRLDLCWAELAINGQHNPAGMGGVMPDGDVRGYEIAVFCLIDIDELLRVAVGQREPGALHLHHEAVAFFEGMGDVIQLE